MTETLTRLPDSISAGGHPAPEYGMCVMETVAYIAGEPHTDQPKCACRIITCFAIAINDAIPDDATRTRILGPLVWAIAGTRSTPEVEQKRAYMCADWALRQIAPLALDAAGLSEAAASLRKLPEIRDQASAGAAYDSATTLEESHISGAQWDTIIAAWDSVVTAATAASAAHNTCAMRAAMRAALAATSATQAVRYTKVSGIWEMCGEFIGRLCEVTA